ncbi:MAG TPA: hypothetical protein VJ983_04695, partial [candidate division Zixibacteria bacterium]|nr:hypothetical protein [candidate division Zixibacteria bacterium]
LYLNKAHKLARQSGALPQLMRIDIMLGKTAAATEDIEACYQYLKSALQSAKTIAQTIDSEEDRRSFQSQESIRYLVEEIRKLGAQIGQKKRAGVQPAPQ